jgi:hypothetical protein
MTEKDIVKFREPMEEGEENLRMVVLEMRGDRVLVTDLSMVNFPIPPTMVYAVSDLEVVK